MTKLYTVKEVAKILRVSEYQLRENIIKTGKLKTIVVGCTKVTEKSLQDFIETYEGTGINAMLG